jgi:hypothetical protein
MAAVDISTALNEARLTATRDYLDSGASSAKLQIYATPRPTPGGAPSPGTLLVELILTEPCGTVAGGVLTVTAVGEATAVGSGTPVWGRFVNGSGAWVIDADAGGPGSNQPIVLSDTSVLAGGKLSLLSCVLG